MVSSWQGTELKKVDYLTQEESQLFGIGPKLTQNLRMSEVKIGHLLAAFVG